MPKPKEAPPEEKIEGAITLTLEPAEPRAGYVANRIEVSRMTNAQRIGLHLLTSSLDANGATLDDGRRVTTAVDAVRWALEQIASQKPEGWKPQGF